MTTNLIQRRQRLAQLLTRVVDAPADWFSGDYCLTHQPHKPQVDPVSCSRYADVEASLREALEWRPVLSDVTAVLFAVCASTMQAGNQLFFHVVGDAGSAKTTLCEGLLVSHTCQEIEHLKNFFSGWKMPGKDGEDKDCSLISRINGKTLITCEADVLIASPYYQQLMSQGRRIFDGRSSATHGNSDKDRKYEGLRTPWIMAGTPALLDVDHSRLGDRYLRIIIDKPDENMKRAILKRAFKSEMASVVNETNGTASSLVDGKTRKAHALMGGYTNYLRANVSNLIPGVQVPDMAAEHCIDLADLTADLRARPNDDRRKQEVHDYKELPTRVARQLGRLAVCLAVVLNKRLVDTDVLRIVRKVALDTASGHSMRVIQWLCGMNHNGCGKTYQESGGLGQGMLENILPTMTKERLERYLAFLRSIDVLEMKVNRTGNIWVLTERVYNLYLRVLEGI